MIPSVFVVIVGDNMEHKSMSYYRTWALFDNNEQCSLRRDAVVMAEHGPPLAGQFGIIGSMPPCAFPATLCQMIMPKHSNRDTNDGRAGRHTESSTGGDDRVSDRNAARATALREPTPSMDYPPAPKAPLVLERRFVKPIAITPLPRPDKAFSS